MRKEKIKKMLAEKRKQMELDKSSIDLSVEKGGIKCTQTVRYGQVGREFGSTVWEEHFKYKGLKSKPVNFSDKLAVVTGAH